jgi:hypothetical protein
MNIVSHVPSYAVSGLNGAWSPGNAMVLTLQGVFQVQAPGGVLKPLVMPDRAQGDYFIGDPQFLPDGRHFLFTVFRGGGSSPRDVYVGTLGTSGLY